MHGGRISGRIRRDVGRETADHDEGPVISMVLQLAGGLAAQVAFAVVRTRKEQQFGEARRLRFTMEAAAMGTWDRDLSTNFVQWPAASQWCALRCRDSGNDVYAADRQVGARHAALKIARQRPPFRPMSCTIRTENEVRRTGRCDP
jgi:hypothetical protein